MSERSESERAELVDDRITQAEVVQIFGDTMPAEAVVLLMNPGDRTTDQLREDLRRLAAQDPAACIKLRPTEIQSGLDRVRWAEGLIRQLPDDHDGRNSWLLNYASEKHEADKVYLSPPPAAGWDEAIEAAMIEIVAVTREWGRSSGSPGQQAIHAHGNRLLDVVKALRHNAPPDSGAGKSEPVWHDGAPPKPWCDEWFIAQTTFNDRVVLTALPEEYSYDFKTADDTYIKADKIKRWMQFPDSQYVPHNNSGKIDPSSLPDHGGADAGVNVSRDVLLTLISVLDCALGDTDPSIDPDYTDDEVKRDYPVFWVCQQLAALSKPAPVAASARAEARLREILTAADLHADGLTNKLDMRDWTPKRAHIEQARNTIRNLVEALSSHPHASEETSRGSDKHD